MAALNLLFPGPGHVFPCQLVPTELPEVFPHEQEALQDVFFPLNERTSICPLK